MDCAAHEHGQTSTFDHRTAVDHARVLLEGALTRSSEDIRAIASQFETLAQDVQVVLDLTAEIVDCVQQDWVQSMVPTVRSLASPARLFIEQRVDSLGAISAVFAGEAATLENLLSLTTEQRSLSREARTLGVLAKIEVARLRAEDRRFEYMARELDQFSTMVASGASKVQGEAEQRRRSLLDRQRKIRLTLDRRVAYFQSIETELRDAILSMDSALADFARVPAEFQRCISLIASNISRVVEAVQMQDITRQQTEHVRDILIRTSRELESGLDIEDRPARRDAVLKVQACQIQSACASSRAWIDEVNQCLESILHVGSSDVLAIGKMILEQERSLSVQLARIDRLEQECAADDAEIEKSLAGIGDLMHITKAHLASSRQARERMQLLNFNSMIEARHLGDQATAVLEITRNIGRISSAWSTLTDRSGAALETMLTSSARAEEAHRLKTLESSMSLQSARRESDKNIEVLSRAAFVADSAGEKVQTAVAAIHDQSQALGNMAGRIAGSIALMQEAQERLLATIRQPAAAATLNDDERQRIEDECAADYSSEIERQILRAALDGGELPQPAAMATGNDVELF